MILSRHHCEIFEGGRGNPLKGSTLRSEFLKGEDSVFIPLPSGPAREGPVGTVILFIKLVIDETEDILDGARMGRG